MAYYQSTISPDKEFLNGNGHQDHTDITNKNTIQVSEEQA